MRPNTDYPYIIKYLNSIFGDTLLGVVLYGSHATGHATSKSDIDLAVLLTKPVSPKRLWESAQTMACRFVKDVDLIDLKEATTVLQKEVLYNGIWLVKVDEPVCNLFETHVFSKYQQLQEDRRDIINDLTGRIKNG